MNLKEIIFGGTMTISLQRVEDGKLIYDVLNRQNAVVLTFAVPHADQLGATFPLTDSTRMYMRWIRKELERRAEEEKLIEEGRREHQTYLESLHGEEG